MQLQGKDKQKCFSLPLLARAYYWLLSNKNITIKAAF